MGPLGWWEWADKDVDYLCVSVVFIQGFCIVINLVKSLSSSDLLQRLKLKGVRSPEVSRALGII